ncbi:MAG: hypothetical protein O7F12_01150 [Nitrospirae bacterium]|nr:hypothetical protein [Nitrospirota bacterium]
MRHTLLRIWLIIWVVTLPLVHIHPDADHAHGMPGHIHGGTYHSILIKASVVADQDHQQYYHHDSFSHDDTFGPSLAPSHPLHSFEDLTYGFSVIKPSIDPESEKSDIPHDGVVIANLEPLSIPSAFTPNWSLKKRPFSILFKLLSPRAPPVLLL